MKNKLNPGGAGIGPGKGWADWRARKDRAIAKPRKNAGAMKFHKMTARAKACEPK